MNENALENVYLKFFESFQIDSVTGILSQYPSVKFITMPYIGSKYYESKRKILFVGMDVGKDETPGRYQSISDRNMNIECDKNFNPHIAGTYCSSLFLLKDIYNWSDVWECFSKFQTYSQATKHINHKIGENPLSYVALTNLHKFVTINRENRAGDLDRKFLERDIEESLFLEEIKILKPEIILFQGKIPSLKTINQIKELDIQILKSFHPSYRKKGGRKPDVFVKSFVEI